MARRSLYPSSVPLAGVLADNTGDQTLQHRALHIKRETTRKKLEEISATRLWGGGGRWVVRAGGQSFESGGSLLATCSIFMFLTSNFLVSQSSKSRLSWKKEHKQSQSKINTAIVCVFTFHSVISVIQCPKLLCSISRWQEDLFVSRPTVPMNVLDSEHHYSTQSFQSCPCFLLFFCSCMSTS